MNSPANQTQNQPQTREKLREPEYASLHLHSMGTLGDTLAEFEGQTINVFGGIPGEDVVAEIFRYRRRRKHHVSAIVRDVVKPSPHRIATPCQYYGLCTGCQWQHIDYAHQLELKQAIVQNELHEYSELQHISVSPTLPAVENFHYRNHARMTVRQGGHIGFTNRITRGFVKIDECLLMAPWINTTIQKMQGKAQETTQMSIRYGVNTDDFLIQPTFHNKDIDIHSGQTHYRERLLGSIFRVASPSFFQVNTKQTERMVELVRERLDLSGDDVLADAYAGVGTFAVLLAPHVKRVIAIEESAAAVKDAAVNTIGRDNIEFLEGKTEDILGTLKEAPDVLILDPPRTGCHPNTLEAVARSRPRRVAYVSCDPESLARDLQILVRDGFEVNKVEPVDMFPQTYHVETVATLSWAG